MFNLIPREFQQTPFAFSRFDKWLDLLTKSHSKNLTPTCFFLSIIRASTLVDAKSCIIEKCTIFIYFISKMLHINASKNVQRCVYLYICYSNCVYLHGYCNSSIYYFSICFSLLSISLSDQLSFSLSSLYLTLTSLSFSHLINHWRHRSLTQASS